MRICCEAPKRDDVVVAAAAVAAKEVEVPAFVVPDDLRAFILLFPVPLASTAAACSNGAVAVVAVPDAVAPDKGPNICPL